MNRGEEVEITSLIFFFQKISCDIKEELVKEEKRKKIQRQCYLQKDEWQGQRVWLLMQ